MGGDCQGKNMGGGKEEGNWTEGGKAAGLLYLFLSCFEEDMREEQGRKNTEE